MADCSNCRNALPPGMNFCPHCGQKIEKAELGSAAITNLTAEGERRQITVMFCDLVDSTALSSKLDPEDLREALHEYHTHAGAAVESFGGVVAQYLGDGLLVYFGVPRAHEDDPERAIRAAMEILASVPRINEQLASSITAANDSPIRVRIGIHTGPVVVDAAQVGNRRDTLAWGETVNVAARLESLAPPDACVISDATSKLVTGLFELDAMGPQSLKGIERPIAVHRLVSSLGQRRRRPATDQSQLPMVGRSEEKERLLTLWSLVEQGQGQVVRITGDPGIGKSRLVEALRQDIPVATQWVELHCSAYYAKSAFFPVVEALRRALDFRSDDEPEAQLAKLHELVAQNPARNDETMSLLAALLSIPLPADTPPVLGDAELLRKKTMHALSAWLHALSEKQPVILLIEDLHWVDPSTHELIELHINHVANYRILVLATHRSTYEPPGPVWERLPSIELEPLTPQDCTAIVEDIAGRDLPADTLNLIVSRSDGVPLFAEEIARSLVEVTPETPGSDVLGNIPTTLQDTLTARLDRLGDAKAIAQLASVLGRNFPRDLLAALSPLDEEGLARSLTQLESAQLLLPDATEGQSNLTFRHALIQKAAYDSLLRRRRRELHADVVHVMEEKFPEILRETPEVVAQHCEADGMPAEAVTYLQKAAQRAHERMALAEEIEHLRHAIKLLLEHAPPGKTRDEQELDLSLALAEQLLATSGMGSPEAAELTARANELCISLGLRDRLFMALLSRAVMDIGRGRNRSALQVSQQLKQLADELDGPQFQAQLTMPLGGALGMTGHPQAALDELTAGALVLKRAEEIGLPEAMADGLRIMCETWAADNLWLLGKPDEALELTQQILERALADDAMPVVHAQGLVGASTIAISRGEVSAASDYAVELIATSEVSGIQFGVAHGNICKGWVMCQQGEGQTGIQRIEDGLVTLVQVGTIMKLSFYLALLAEQYVAIGDLTGAENALERGFNHASEYDEVFYLAELERLHGVVAQTWHQNDEAVRWYEQAAATALGQGALTLELRALTYWSQIARADVIDRLTSACANYPEQAGSQDLQAAKAAVASTG